MVDLHPRTRRLAALTLVVAVVATLVTISAPIASAVPRPVTAPVARGTAGPEPDARPQVASTAGGYTALSPARLLDTRVSSGELAGVAPLAGGRVDVRVLGRGGVPASGVGAVVLNVTAVEPSVDTYLTVWPAGEARPGTSNVNLRAGQIVANAVIAKVGADGSVSIGNYNGHVDVVVDVMGWFAADAGLTALSPARLSDTRVSSGELAGVAPLAGGRVDVRVLGRGGVPASGVGAVVLNVTAVEPSVDTYLTVWPAGEARPGTSNVNLRAGQIVANAVIAKVGADGSVSIGNYNGHVDVVVDVMGWFAAGAGVTSLSPARLLDTRVSSGELAGVAPAAGGRVDVLVLGRGGVPTVGVEAVVVNVTAVEPTVDTYLTVWPSGEVRPGTSNVNLRGGRIVANAVIAKIGADGRISIGNYAGRVDVVVDVLAWIATPPAPNSPSDPTPPVTTTPTTSAPPTTATTVPPATDPPATNPPVTNPPSTDPPVTDPQVTNPPVTDPPVTNPPVTDPPVTDPPVTDPPVTDPPVTNPPSTDPPVTDPPVTDPPVTNPPVTDPPVTDPPVTDPPVTDPPVTSPPSTDPPGTNPPTGEHGSWDFAAATSSLTHEGDSIVVALRAADRDGTPTGETLPGGTTVRVIGDEGSVTVADLGGGRFRLTATDEVGSIVLAVRVPGQEQAAAIAVSNLRLQPGVQTVTDDAILFPIPNLPDGVAQEDAGVPGVTGTHAGPFTKDEVAARAEIDKDGDGDIGAVRAPWVLRGPAPATGTLLFGVGGSQLFGRVVEPDGLPTLSRDGFALVTVELADLPDVYRDMRWHVDQDALTGAQVMPLGLQFEYACPDATPAADCPEPVLTDPVVVWADGATTPVDELIQGGATNGLLSSPTGPFGRSRPMPAADGDGDDLPPEPTGATCKSTVQQTVANFELKPLGTTFVGWNLGGSYFNSFDDFRLGLGLTLKLSGGVSATIQAKIKATIECTIAKLGKLSVPAEVLGPVGEVATPHIGAELATSGDIGVSAGPRVGVSASCKGQIKPVVGFERTPAHTGPIGELNPDFGWDKCTVSGGFVGSDTNGSMPAQLDLSVWAYMKFPVSLSLGGRVIDALFDWIGKGDSNEVGLLAAKAGPRLKVTFENQDNALVNKEAKSGIAVDFAGSVSIDSKALTFAIKKLTGSSNDAVGTSITLLEGSNPIASAYPPLNPKSSDPVTAKVNGDGPKPLAPLDVVIGDVVDLDVAMSYKDLGAAIAQSEISGGSAWLALPGRLTQVPEIAFQPKAGNAPPADQRMTAQFTVTADLCDTLGKDGSEVLFLADAGLGVVPTPGYGGSATIRCKPPKIELDKHSLIFGPEAIGSTSTVVIRQEALDRRHWKVAGPGGAALPEWLKVTPQGGQPDTGTFPSDDEPSELTVGIDCNAVNPRAEVTTTIVVTVTDPPAGVTKPLTDQATVSAECRDVYVKLQPKAITGTGHVTLKTEGHSVGVWKFDPVSLSGAPKWLKDAAGHVAVSPVDGTYGDGVHTEQVGVTVASRAAICDDQAARSYTLKVVTSYRSGPEEDRGTATLTVTQPAVPGTGGPGCKKPRGSSKGDPHLTSFDGQYFDAQVLGEYTYVTPVAGDTSGPTLQVRHELTVPGAVSEWAPTSVTAIALREQGRLVEVYRRPTFLVRLDGNTIDLVDGVPVELAPGFSVTRTGTSVRVVADDVDLTVSQYGSILDLAVEMPSGTPVHGLLGTPDGDPGDDLVGADGTTYTVGQLGLHGADSPLYHLTDSWRLHDEADSLFTLSYEGFADDNPIIDPSKLAAYRAKVLDQIGALAAVCDGTGSNMVESLALELAIRGEDATLADVAGFSCSYVVTGTASAPSPGSDQAQGLGGLQVIVDGVGLTPCTTTTAADGTYTCELRPALDEVTSDDPLDIVASVNARWPGDAEDAFAGEVAFSDRAPIAGARRATADIDVDPATLPAVNVNGTMVKDGGPVTTPVLVVLQGYGADGALVATYRQSTQPAGDGTYSLVRVMPRAATRVIATAQVGMSQSEWFNAETTALTPGSTTSLRLDVDLTTPTVVISGTLKINGRPVTTPTDIEYNATQANGANLESGRLTVQPNPATGAYTLSIALPRTAAAVRLTAYLGLYWDAQTKAVDGLRPGANPVAWDVDLAVPQLQVSGTITRDGVPVTTPTGLTAHLYLGNCLCYVYNYTVTPDAAGHYATTVLGLSTTSRITLYLETGPQDGDRFPLDVTGLTPGTRNVTLDADVRPATLTLDGHLRKGGAPLAGTTNLWIVTDDGAGNGTGTVYVDGVAVDGDGTFTTAPQLLPARARHVLVYVVNSSLAQTESFAFDVAAGSQTKTIELDERPASVHVFGHLTGEGLGEGASVRFDIVEWAGGVNPAIPQRFVTLGAGGSFDFTLELPANITNVQVVAIFDTQAYRSDFPVVSVNTPSSVSTPVPVNIELDYHPSRLTLSGHLLAGGRPITDGGWMQLNAYDAGGELLSQLSDVYPDVDPGDGSYTADERLLPLRTARVDVTYRVTVDDIDRVLRASITDLPDGESVTRDFSVDLDHVAGNIHLAGNVTVDGASAAAGTELPFFVTVSTVPTGTTDDDAVDPEPHYLTPSVVVDDQGRYELDVQFNPDEGTVISSVSVYVGLGDGAWLDLTPEQLGTVVEWNIDISLTKMVVTGRVLVDGQPLADDGVYGTADDLRIEGAQFTFDPSRPDGYTPSGGFGNVALRNADGSFSFTKTFPRSTDVVALVATVDGRTYTRRVDIHQPAAGEGPSTVNVTWDLNIDSSTMNVRLDGPVLACSGSDVLRPQLLDAKVWAFPQSLGFGTWASQGQQVAAADIVPEYDWEDGGWHYRLGLDVPAGTVDVGVEYATSSVYGASPWAAVAAAGSTGVVALGGGHIAPIAVQGPCM